MHVNRKPRAYVPDAFVPHLLAFKRMHMQLTDFTYGACARAASLTQTNITHLRAFSLSIHLSKVIAMSKSNLFNDVELM